MTWQLIHADCIEAMRGMDEASVDAIVTDPPYGLEFMGKEWDSFNGADVPMRRRPEIDALNAGQSRQGGRQRAGVDYQKRQARDMRSFGQWCETWATEALRVLKPGGHLLSFGGTRTYHRLVCALEDAGFEIRDCLAWLYGSGFPKSLDVSKAIDKAAGAAREVVGMRQPFGREGRTTYTAGTGDAMARADDFPVSDGGIPDTAPATPDAERWQGWGTALKPAFEPIVLARKPLSGTVAQNVLEFGTGALNVDGTRIGMDAADRAVVDRRSGAGRDETADIYAPGLGRDEGERFTSAQGGRWPANVLLDAEAAAALDEQSGESTSPVSRPRTPDGPPQATWSLGRTGGVQVGHGDRGGASRFFYTAKTSRAERERGVRDYGGLEPNGMSDDGYGSIQTPILDRATPRENWTPREVRNNHPTVKPVDLMQWLCRLITPPGGVVLDPFTGSGSTGIAALREGFSFVGIERETEYVEIARARIIGDAPLFAAGSEVIAETTSP